MFDRLKTRVLRPVNATAADLRAEQAALAARFDALALELRDLNATTTNGYRAVTDDLRSEIDHSVTYTRDETAQIRIWVEEYITAVRLHLEQHANEAVTVATESLQSRLRRVERAARQVPGPTAAPSGGTAEPRAGGPSGASSAISELGIDYSSFEDRLRGSVEHVRALEAVHVETILAFGAEGLPVLDIGCGRGEFVQLLTEAGIPARGIDLNPESVDDCVEAGLDVVLGDAVAYLRSLEAGSLRAVCGFHLVEHLTDAVRSEMLAAAHHAIAPGGGIILETPNPENLRVGATTFWLDPTHLRPIPPQLLQFQAEQAGFEAVEIQRLHPSEEVLVVDGPVEPSLQPVIEFVNGLIAGPMDYAVVGRVVQDDNVDRSSDS